MTTEGSERAIAHLAAGRLDAVRMDLLPATIRPASVHEAYALQSALRERLTLLFR